MKQRTTRNNATATGPGAVSSRGFLLLVVIGILAVLLTVCIGFLSYTRGEILAVSAQRNKSDVVDVMHTALDYTLANICTDQMSGTGSMDEKVPCAYTLTPGATGLTGSPWWFRTLQNGTCDFLPRNDSIVGGGWGFSLKPATQPGVETNWIYLPADYFPGGAIRGRAQVQVMDTNCCINVNDWNEDGMPSQAQMAHMIADGYGPLYLESLRRGRDVASPNGVPYNPLRYHEAWRVASHSARYMAWPDWDYHSDGAPINNTASFCFATKNSSWLSMYGPQYSCISSIIQSDGIPLGQTTAATVYLGSQLYATVNPCPAPKQYDRTPPTNPSGFTWGNPQSAGFLPWGMAGFFTTGYTDPDTGRSPVNVNTCYNSGEILPFDYWSNPPCYTMEGVWNVESLRRIIKVGWFNDPWSTYCMIGGVKTLRTAVPAASGGTTWSNAQRDWCVLDPRAKILVETLKLQLAYQYQETLCRYFTGTYSHGGVNQKFKPFSATAIKTYPSTYTPATTPLPAPTHPCLVTNYSAPRFPVSLTDFRNHVRDDLVNCLSKNFTNPAYTTAVAGLPPGTPLPPRPAGQLDATYTDGTVNFVFVGPGFVPEIAPGKLDVRTACACYDNMVPGKPVDITVFNGCTAYGAGDPIYELYALQVGRQEDMDDAYQIDASIIHDSAINGINGTDVRPSRKKLGATNNGNPTFNLGTVPSPAVYPFSLVTWPLPALTAATKIGNISSRWVDNPQLSATSYYSSFNGPDPAWEAHLYDHHTRMMTLLPKGNDICSRNAFDPADGRKFNGTVVTGSPEIPTGPWLDDMVLGSGGTIVSTGYNQMNRSGSNQHDVPFRQLCFTPDSFSTELTTTSTTFLIIVNAQLVDQASVVANPGNPALHLDQSWNQWGCVVQIAPDVKVETSVSEPATKNMLKTVPPDPNMQTPNGPAAPDAQFWQWYKNEMPRRVKTYQGTLPMTSNGWLDDSYLDDACPSLYARNRGNTGAYTTPFGRTSNQPRMPWKGVGGYNPAMSGGVAELENSNSTHIRDWKRALNPGEITTGCDINQVPPAGVPSGRGADVIYTPANQIKKRIIIRSIWCLNQGIEQQRATQGD